MLPILELKTVKHDIEGDAFFSYVDESVSSRSTLGPNNTSKGTFTAEKKFCCSHFAVNVRQGVGNLDIGDFDL